MSRLFRSLSRAGQARDAAAEQLSWLEQRNHHPCVGASNPSSATTIFPCKTEMKRWAEGRGGLLLTI